MTLKLPTYQLTQPVPPAPARRGACCGLPNLPRRSAGFCLGLLLTALIAVHVMAYAEDARKLKSGPPPEYPELARRLNIHGMARVRLTVAPDGSVKEVKEIGGNPVLVESLVRTVKKWKYEPADKTSMIEIKFDFGQQ